MNTLKGWISTTCLAVLIMASTVQANDGVVIGGFSSEASSTCSAPVKDKGRLNLGGVIIDGIGVVIGGLTGVVIGGFSGGESTQSCGVIIGG